MAVSRLAHVPDHVSQLTHEGRPVRTVLLAASSALLLLLPFVTTFDDLLTAAAMRLDAIGPFHAVAVGETRMVAGLLATAGMPASASGSHPPVRGAHGGLPELHISWNRGGRQSPGLPRPPL